ncbi:uncharacterized protein LOC131165507 [Malania oleifera]|uniref:uncharacterized protein LOC131165507 n=1 Tax=Malania oleifera TaxID=397392 RepID=UPI0025ADC3C6|nr:uncharacterized protein LOC131165507 [Malania oleifera]
MASLGIRCGCGAWKPPPSPFSSPSPAVSIPSFRLRLNPKDPAHRRPIIARSSFPTVSAPIRRSIAAGSEATGRDEESPGVVNSEKLDEWMRESAAEIVRNLREAPLFVHVVENKNDDGEIRVRTEKAVAEDWCALSKKWKTGERESPQGIMLVEELGEEREKNKKAWGVVIQGRGLDCGPACYVLETSSVRSPTPASCTHFCVARVRSFKETAQSLLSNCWLLQ